MNKKYHYGELADKVREFFKYLDIGQSREVEKSEGKEIYMKFMYMRSMGYFPKEMKIQSRTIGDVVKFTRTA